MSKSKGNVVNPQEVIEEFGSDALRLGLIASRSAGQNQAFGKDKVIAGRNFCNKLWNIARYVEHVLGDSITEAGEPNPQTPADHWIIRELSAAKTQTASMLEEYRFSEAFETVYHTIWDKVADWYIESTKTSCNADTLLWVLEACLVMAHPFAPFVTETIWQTLDWHPANEDMLITTKWQLHENYDHNKADNFEKLRSVITEIREILSTINVRDIDLFIEESHLVAQNDELITKMTPVALVQKTDEPSGLRLTNTTDHVWLDLSDDEINAYKTKLEEKLEDTESAIHALEHRLANESYVNNAPEALVAESREELELKNNQAEHLKHQLKHL